MTDNRYIIGDDYRDPKHGCLAYLLALALVILCCVCFSGCKPLERSTKNDHSLDITTESTDSIVGVAGDSAMAALLLRCDSLGNVYLDELLTEQGKRIRMEIELRNKQRQLDSLDNLKPTEPRRNQPLLIQMDCKEDSLQVVVHALRQKITEYEKNDTLRTEYVKYVPDYYKNCERGFWTLLVFAILVAGWAAMSYIPQTRPIKKAIRAFLRL